MQPEYDFIIRSDKRLGYLPTIKTDGKEVYRGEWKKSFDDALFFGRLAMERLGLK